MLRSLPFSIAARKRPSVLTLLTIVTGALSGASWYTYRLATLNPDVGWKEKQSGMANLRYSENQQYKLYSPSLDYSSLGVPQGSTTVVKF